MAQRRVRIYAGRDNESSVIGFSASAADAPDHPDFRRFMATRGYQIYDVSSDQIPEESTSLRHMEVRPPLTDADIKEFGTLCVGGVVSGEWTEGIVDPYHDGTIVLDNRIIDPGMPLGGGTIITRA